MSQNVPWLSQMQLCSVCGKVTNLANESRMLLCGLCEEMSYGSIKTYACGDAPISHIENIRVPRGYMFNQKVLDVFAINMARLSDLGAFKKWWESNTLGADKPGMPSIQRFLNMVIALYNKRCENKAPFMQPVKQAAAPRFPRSWEGRTITVLPAGMTGKLEIPDIDITPLEAKADIPADPTSAKTETALQGEPVGEVPHEVEAVQEEVKSRGNKKKSHQQKVEA